MKTPAEILRLHHGDNSDLKSHLLALSRSLEARIQTSAPDDLVVATVQDVRFLTPRTQAAFERIAATGARTYLAGMGRPVRPLRNVTWIEISPNSSMRHEWSVILVRRAGSAAMVAKEMFPGLLDPAPTDAERRFRWRIVDDPALVLRCANAVVNLQFAPKLLVEAP